MSKSYKAYNDNDPAYHKRGDDSEDFVSGCLVDIGYRVQNTQRGKDYAARFEGDAPLLCPDLMAFSLEGQDMFEVKSKTPTSYDTFGFSVRQLSQEERIARGFNSPLWIIVQDQSISTNTSNLYSYMIADVLDLWQHKVAEIAGDAYYPRSAFEPFGEWLETMKDIIEEERTRREKIASGEISNIPLFIARPAHLLNEPSVKVIAANDNQAMEGAA